MADFENYSFPAKRNKRTRKKRIINDIKKQISFYFSDSNLSRDKFLSNLILNSTEGYVPIDTIASFSRIQEINCDRKILVKAMGMIPELQLNDEETMIRRKEEINFNYNADDRSIYIENIPPKFDHKRLEQVLSKYGTIMHISLPRYHNNREFKGFGFIEFKTEEQTQAALKGLGWVKESDELSAARGASTANSIIPRPQNLRLSDSSSIPCTPTKVTPDTPTISSETEGCKDSSCETKKKRRRRRSSICISELKSGEIFDKPRDPLLMLENKPEAVSRKRKKTSIDTVSPINSKVRRLTSSCSESETPSKDHVTQPSETQIKKKLELAKAKNRKKRKQKEKQKEELLGIRVFPKKEWLVLKQKYKELQKKQISEIKKDLGIKPRSSDAIKLLGLPEGFSEDEIRALFNEAVINIYKKEDFTVVKFCTNPGSYNSTTLPQNVKIANLTDAEVQQLEIDSAAKQQERYKRRRKSKVRGYLKVIKKCSAQDQTLQQ